MHQDVKHSRSRQTSDGFNSFSPSSKRKNWMRYLGASVSRFFSPSRSQTFSNSSPPYVESFPEALPKEDVFTYIKRIKGKFNLPLYKHIVGAANEFKEGDEIIGVAAAEDNDRAIARDLLSNTTLSDFLQHPLYTDAVYHLIQRTTFLDTAVLNMTLGDLKQFLLAAEETSIKQIMPSLSSDLIALVVKLMRNEELILVSRKVFNPLPNSNIGAKGYLSARVQPNSPTDNVEDIFWQVLNAWSFAVGDLVLGTNPVSSDPAMVAQIEKTLYDVLVTFELEQTLPNCVLSHIDIQSQVEALQPGTTGIWFQSIASTLAANHTFDVTIEKMEAHVDARRNQPFGLYAETGQGADATNGHSEGFDMVVHESRKYGFIRALKQRMNTGKLPHEQPWVFVNDVAGFIGPEVFRTKEQLVRCCLEDIAMAKLHGLTIGLDICTTLHMDVTLDDLDWCIDQIMPANPAYCMALPTKYDPMLSYLTTSFGDHLRVREKWNYKINEPMWAFFQRIGVIGADNKPTVHFGDPTHVYVHYRRAKGDTRSELTIQQEGQEAIERVRQRGVPIVNGYGENTWQLMPQLEDNIRALYQDAKYCLWTEWEQHYLTSMDNAIILSTNSIDRIDYVYHPISGESLSSESIDVIQQLRVSCQQSLPDVLVLISDGLNVQALMDEGHLNTFLPGLYQGMRPHTLSIAPVPIVLRNGRVRAGYEVGSEFFGGEDSKKHCIVHIIGERPGTMHRNFSVYITTASASTWNSRGMVDHNITRVVSGISDTSYFPQEAAKEVAAIIHDQMRIQ
ncbi:MAG: ethanolamine ammonia-lyase subunit EutB [Cytophagaceae bacterium]|jgi:ethanolamine ammonia-lyase large subunit|nr:ethanolamine ammonia-lyase subunit EutB [Cytophagaceae bacterium]